MALQVAEQMSDFLLHGAVANALNMPSVTVEEALRARASDVHVEPMAERIRVRSV